MLEILLLENIPQKARFLVSKNVKRTLKNLYFWFYESLEDNWDRNPKMKGPAILKMRRGFAESWLLNGNQKKKQ